MEEFISFKHTNALQIIRSLVHNKQKITIIKIDNKLKKNIMLIQELNNINMKVTVQRKNIIQKLSKYLRPHVDLII